MAAWSGRVSAAGITGYDRSFIQAGIEVSTISNTPTSITFRVQGLIYFEEYTGWSSGNITVNDVSVGSGNITPSPSPTGYYYGGYRDFTFTKLTYAQSTGFYVNVWVGVEASVSFTATIPAIDHYAVAYYKNDDSGTSSSATKWYNTAYTIANPWSSHISEGTSVAGYKVSFNLNGGSGTTPTAQTSTRTRKYTFKQWNTKANGTGTAYAKGATYTANAALTLYQIWNLTYANNSITLPSAPSRTGYTFKGWYSAASGGTKIGNAGASYTPTAAITLYAQWTANTQTVSFNANGGTTPIASKKVTYGSPYGALPTPERPGYEFLGWYTAATGGTLITEDVIFNKTTDQNLYAQWKVMGATHVFNDGEWKRSLCYIATDDGWKHTLPYVYTSDGWQLTIF